MSDLAEPETRDVRAPWGAVIRTIADDRSLEPEFLRTGAYEPTEMAILEGLIGPGMNVLDVGAGFGYHTVFASHRVGVTGRVVAVEPDPANFALVAHNIAANGCHNAQVLPTAVGDDHDPVRLFRSGTNHGRHSLYAENVVNIAAEITVPSTTVDDLVDDFFPNGRLDVLKIDAEGAEARILRGATRTLHCPDLALWVEIWPRGLQRADGTDSRRLVAGLEEMGFVYQGYLFDDDFALVPVPRERALAQPTIQYGRFTRPAW